MFECFHCLMKMVIRDSDFTFEDYGMDDGDGIVHCLHCENCGSRIEYFVPLDGQWDDDVETEAKEEDAH